MDKSFYKTLAAFFAALVLYAVIVADYHTKKPPELNPYSPSIETADYAPNADYDIDDDAEVDWPIFNNSDVGCLAVALFHEARNQPDDGLVAVANVIMNRVKVGQHPSTICEVIYRGCHFSFVCDKTKQYDPAGAKHSLDRSSWIKIYARSKELIISYNGVGFVDITKGATYYHSTKVKPKWRKYREKTVTIGDHIFYKRV
jgi:spore germination cell wall hydrolase CwlJ-like protein